jgi:serine protease Do
MSTRKTSLVYTLLILVSGLAVGMVIASRLDLTPQSAAQTFAAPSMNSAPVTGPLDAQTFRNVAKAQSPIVVNIRTESRQRMQDLSDFFGGGGGSPDDLLRRFFDQPGAPGGGQGGQGRPGDQGGGSPPSRERRPREQTTVAAGTGFIISKDGLILTNNHVVEGATKIEVSLYGEDLDQLYEAKLVGRDELTDSALIQLTEKPNHTLPEARFGDSAQMAPGDWVMAIGNPFGLSHTVSVGVISAIERTPFDMTRGRRTALLQTDAAINPGNSGGPLLNLRGEVIGMNTAIISNGRAEGNIGIGFAIPINSVRELLPQLSTGKVIRGRIGVEVQAVPREGFEDFGLKARTGALVAKLAPGGAADKAGVEPGDVITEFNGRPVPNTTDLVNMVTATKPGTTVPLKLLRDKRERTVNVTIEELDLAAEQGVRASRTNDRPAPDQGSESFGLTIVDLTAQRARQLELPSGRTGAVISEVDPDGPSAGALRAGDVILSVNRQRVSNAAEAGRELQRVAAGRIAQILIWRDGGEVFVTVRKE